MFSVNDPRSNRHATRSATAILCVLLIPILGGCLSRQDNELVVYTALDREFSQPILDDLGRELQFTIRAKFDQESNKTVGLANEILQSRQRPPADLFWNNEILHTIRLDKAGLLEPWDSTQSSRYPDSYQSTHGTWYGFAARARVLVINTDSLPDPNDRPDSIHDLADPRWKGKCGMARPVFGTTATHAAVLLANLGREEGERLLTAISANAVIEGGNRQVAMKVARGQLAFGLTDTDDALIELEQGSPVAIVFPDQGPDQMGTLLIPNTIAIVKGGPNPNRARKLLDRLLQADIEQRLATGASGQIPLASDVEARSRVQPVSVPPGRGFKIMKVDFERAADQWEIDRPFLESM